ncbi:hypothetical protein DB29_00898 [Shouchella clausii]|nr:hypothetical protein DB29_00898 [Shouchella clausii]
MKKQGTFSKKQVNLFFREGASLKKGYKNAASKRKKLRFH